MPSNHLILCRPLPLLPSIFPSIRVFSNESVLGIWWPKYWSFSISPSNEYSGLISIRMDWLDLLAVQGTLKSLLQQHSSKASIRGKRWVLLFIALLIRKVKFRKDRHLGQDFFSLSLSLSTPHPQTLCSRFLFLSLFSTVSLPVSQSQGFSDTEHANRVVHRMAISLLLNKWWVFFLGRIREGFAREMVLELETERYSGQVTVTFLI